MWAICHFWNVLKSYGFFFPRSLLAYMIDRLILYDQERQEETTVLHRKKVKKIRNNYFHLNFQTESAEHYDLQGLLHFIGASFGSPQRNRRHTRAQQLCLRAGKLPFPTKYRRKNKLKKLKGGAIVLRPQQGREPRVRVLRGTISLELF